MSKFSVIKTAKQAALRFRDKFVAFRSLAKQRKGRTKAHALRHPDYQLGAVIILSMVALSFIFLDTPAGHWKSTVSPELYKAFRFLTDFGKAEVFLIPGGIAILALGLLSWSKLSKSALAVMTRIQLLGLFVVIAIAGSGLSNNLLKVLIGRARPRHFEELGAFHFETLGLSSGFQSFPSGHSATAGAMAMILILLVPRLKWTWLAIGAWIAFSRIVVGAHYPSDTIAGFTYGMLFTWLVAIWFARRDLLFHLREGRISLPKTTTLSWQRLRKALHMLR